jgi:hypothetical protein
MAHDLSQAMKGHSISHPIAKAVTQIMWTEPGNSCLLSVRLDNEAKSAWSEAVMGACGGKHIALLPEPLILIGL